MIKLPAPKYGMLTAIGARAIKRRDLAGEWVQLFSHGIQRAPSLCFVEGSRAKLSPCFHYHPSPFPEEFFDEVWWAQYPGMNWVAWLPDGGYWALSSVEMFFNDGWHKTPKNILKPWEVTSLLGCDLLEWPGDPRDSLFNRRWATAVIRPKVREATADAI